MAEFYFLMHSGISRTEDDRDVIFAFLCFFFEQLADLPFGTIFVFCRLQELIALP